MKPIAASSPGVAGDQPPAFVERCGRTLESRTRCRVAGDQPPAFVERRRRAGASSLAPCVAGDQPPAFVERAHTKSRTKRRCACVAGDQPPAFVERAAPNGWGASAATVSPGINPRPSLSGQRRRQDRARIRVSPGINPRPSLSDHTRTTCRLWRDGVAGDQPPAFVERTHWPPAFRRTASVSPGINPRPSLSAHERGRRDRADRMSPGINPRPSLSAGATRAGAAGDCACRRGSTPGLR